MPPFAPCLVHRWSQDLGEQETPPLSVTLTFSPKYYYFQVYVSYFDAIISLPFLQIDLKGMFL